MPITMKIVEADQKTKKRYTAVFRLHRGGPVIKITNFGQRGEQAISVFTSFGEIQHR